MMKIDNYYAGRQQAPELGQYISVEEPAIGTVYAEVADSTMEDVNQAVQAAEQAHRAWANTSVELRAGYLSAIADEIERRLPILALAESKDTGKPLSLAQQVDIPRAANNFRFFAHAITQWGTEAFPMGNQALNYTLREPIGVVGCISPWNLPLYLLTWKIAPALATGNCVIAKPSELTPMTAHMLGEICNHVGLPSGVLNILHGKGQTVGTAITSHPGVKAISFTGGTETGRAIAKQVGPLFKKLSLELGGKNPIIVFADCDFEQAVTQVMRAAFSNQGQVCLCGSRIYVENAIYDRFKQALLDKVKQLQVGDPLTETTQMGALISASHLDKVLSYVEMGKQAGGQLLCGGDAVKLSGRCEAGSFMQPTMFEGIDVSHRINQEEIFGPVLTLQKFDDESEVVQMANDSAYGLCASVWSQQLQRCHRMARQLEVGMVWVNSWMLRDLRTPFGGYKQSGVGREGGVEALRFFTETKNVCVGYS